MEMGSIPFDKKRLAHVGATPQMPPMTQTLTPTAPSPAAQAAMRATPPTPRTYQGVNWTGLKTLYLKEVRRFWKVGMQTVAAPVVTTLLYMLIFVVAMRGARPVVEGVPFAQFVAPGLIMMAILNNAFANASSSLIQAKIMGTAPDFLTPPLSPFELTAAFSLGAATRGVFVGFVTAVSVWPFAHFGFAHLAAALYFGFAASMLMGFVGLLTGLWAEKFDHLAAITNFIVMPLTFLSGTFYSVTALPAAFRAAVAFNPFFYLIDGFRYGFVGHSDGDVAIGVAYTAGLVVALGVASWLVIRSGWRLKS
jgi:ABC-2 type transport system permease protein